MVLRKSFEKVLPPQPVYWLSEYHTKEEIWNNLKRTYGSNERPNVLFILADDLGVNDISGGAGIATPNIDSIARNGLNFTQAYSSQATCAPSRAALFTGRYPTNIGYEFTPIPKVLSQFMARRLNPLSPQPTYNQHLFHEVPDMIDISMPTDVPTIAEILHQVGYHSYLIGKWDGGFSNSTSPLGRGFDESLSIQVGGSLYAKVNDPNIVKTNNISFDQVLKKMLSFKISHNNGPFFEPDEYLTDYMGKQASTLINDLGKKREEVRQQFEDRDEPWFMTVAFTAPHNPFQALKSDFEREDIQKIPSFIGKIYASMILALDRNVGRILDALKESGQYENTIVIFTSDNGAAPYVGLPHLNAPYRGWKGTLFEGGIRIPFLMQWPQGLRRANEKVHEMMMHIDILPSIYRLATRGIEFLRRDVIRPFTTDGRDILLPLVSKQTSHTNRTSPGPGRTDALDKWLPAPVDLSGGSDARTLFWRSGDYKALRYGDYKLQIHTNPNKMWFYNLRLDPSERNNLIPLINQGQPEEPAIHSSDDLRRYLQCSQNRTTLGCPASPSSQLVSLITSASSAQFPAIHAITQELARYGHSVDGLASRDALLSHLVLCYEKLLEIDGDQKPSLWPSLVGVPVCIDKPAMSSNECLLTDEYIVWPN